jgi:iron(III) transport system substrate-binding protein
MRTPLVLPALLVTATLALAGCSPQSGADASSDGPLIVYTNSYDSGRGDWLTAEAEKAGFDIQIVENGGADTTDKVLAEKGNPVADVVFGLTQSYFSQLEDAGTLEAYSPSWAGETDTSMGDSSGAGAYWPLVQQAILLTYDADRTSASAAPSDWPDLWNDPTYKGRYESANNMGSTTSQVLVASILSRYADPDGELGVSAEGWDQIKEYFANGSPAGPDTELFQRLADGDVDYGPRASSSIAGLEKKYGFTAGIVTPDIGVPFIVEQVGIVKGTKNLTRSEAFVDWFGSAETQAAWSAQFDSMPVNKDAIAQVKPEIADFYSKLTPQDIDWGFVTANLPAWREKIELEDIR